MAHSFDVTKARTLMYYLGRASNKLAERELARKKVKVAIEQLKKISEKNVKKDLEELERRIAEALVKEKRILAVQRDEDVEHSELVSKIDMLQGKLDKYLQSSESRQERVRDLERKILKATRPRTYELLVLKEGLVELEKRYREEQESGDYTPAELRTIEQQLKALKARIRMLESENGSSSLRR